MKPSHPGHAEANEYFVNSVFIALWSGMEGSGREMHGEWEGRGENREEGENGLGLGLKGK